MPSLDAAIREKLGPLFSKDRTYSLVSYTSLKERPEAEGWRSDGDLTFGADHFTIYSRPTAAPPKEIPSVPAERRPVRDPAPAPAQGPSRGFRGGGTKAL